MTTPEAGGAGAPARLEVEQAQVGRFPAIPGLNPAMDPDHLLLKLRLRVQWAPPRPGEAFAALRERLAEVSPSLRQHRCAGEAAYQVTADRPRGAPAGPGARPAGEAAFEAPLALAHLVEHLIIDVVGYISGPRKVAGVTGAPRGGTGAYDIFVECDDPMLAAVAIPLALAWTRCSLAGTPLDGAGRPALEVARHLYKARPLTTNAAEVRASLGRSADDIDRALAWLEEHGYACRIPYAMNFSALPYIRVCNLPPRKGAAG